MLLDLLEEMDKDEEEEEELEVDLESCLASFGSETLETSASYNEEPKRPIRTTGASINLIATLLTLWYVRDVDLMGE